MNRVEVKIIDYIQSDNIILAEFKYPDYPDLSINNSRFNFDILNANVSSLDHVLKMIARTGLLMLQQELDNIKIKNDTVFLNSIASTVGQTYIYTKADFPYE